MLMLVCVLVQQWFVYEEEEEVTKNVLLLQNSQSNSLLFILKVIPPFKSMHYANRYFGLNTYYGLGGRFKL